MMTKTKIALAAALILGTASAVLAADSGENNLGGSVRPGSMDGANPVYHPRWFGHVGSAGDAYGYVLPTQKYHSVQDRIQERTSDRIDDNR